jgi:hypothetical protein
MAGYLFADGFEYCAKWIWVDEDDGPRAKSTDGAACGGWFELETMEARADKAPRGREAEPTTGRITGSIFDRSSGDPIVGAKVLFALDGALAGWAETDSDGRYVSVELTEGMYSVMTHGADNYLHEQWSGLQCWSAPDPSLGFPVAVDGGMIKAGVDFRLERGIRVAGTVSDADTGLAIAGAMVRILSAQGKVVAEAVSDEQGRYRTLPLPAGEYTAVGSVEGSESKVTSSVTAVTAVCGIARADVVLP